MTAFTFDAKAALNQAQKCRGLPTLPTLPTNEAGDLGKVGTVGTVGAIRASDPEIMPADLARDLCKDRTATKANNSLVSQWQREADDICNPDNWTSSPNERNLT